MKKKFIIVLACVFMLAGTLSARGLGLSLEVGVDIKRD